MGHRNGQEHVDRGPNAWKNYVAVVRKSFLSVDKNTRERTEVVGTSKRGTRESYVRAGTLSGKRREIFAVEVVVAMVALEFAFTRRLCNKNSYKFAGLSLLH